MKPIRYRNKNAGRLIVKTGLIGYFLLNSFQSFSKISVARIFSNHMVIQRDQPALLWGWADVNEKVTVLFNKTEFILKAGPDGTWNIQLPSHAAGGPFEIEIRGSENSVLISDIYFGDVWVCSGQSNMDFRVKSANNAKFEISNADYPLIRQLEVRKAGASSVKDDLPEKSEWWVCNSKTVSDFSAVAYFFAREMYKDNKVPIGVIHSSWGGSPIETFMPANAFSEFSDQQKQVSAITGPQFIHEVSQKNQISKEEWWARFLASSSYITKEEKLNRSSSFFDADGWQSIELPGYAEEQNKMVRKGYTWYKKEIDLPEATPVSEAVLSLGRIRSSNITFINGIKVGSRISFDDKSEYKLPEKLLKPGKNEILICSFNENIRTGFLPSLKPFITIKGRTDTIPLTGTWLFKQARVSDKTGMLNPMWRGNGFIHSYPTLVYNAMIAPLTKFGIKGFIWYQGEANRRAPSCWLYEKMLTNLVLSWRSAWSLGNLPFLIVQLPNYGPATAEPVPSGWNIIQEAQFKVSKVIPGAAMIVTNDLGDSINIHPVYKQEVGRRLSLIAREKAYGEKNTVAEGPAFKSVIKEGNKMVLSFDHTGSGIVSKNGTGQLNGFAIAGSDHQFYRAEAKVSGNKVIVWSKQVSDPADVRYAFESNPPVINFYNNEGLPARPFRTDDLKEIVSGPY